MNLTKLKESIQYGKGAIVHISPTICGKVTLTENVYKIEYHDNGKVTEKLTFKYDLALKYMNDIAVLNEWEGIK